MPQSVSHNTPWLPGKLIEDARNDGWVYVPRPVEGEQTSHSLHRFAVLVVVFCCGARVLRARCRGLRLSRVGYCRYRAHGRLTRFVRDSPHPLLLRIASEEPEKLHGSSAALRVVAALDFLCLHYRRGV